MRVIWVIMSVLIILGSIAEAEEFQERIDNFFLKFTDKNDNISSLFSESFLKQVPETKIIEIRNNFAEQFGNFEKAVWESGKKMEVFYEKCTMPGSIDFDSLGMVTALWFGVPKFKQDSWESIEEALRKIHGKVSLCIRKDGSEIYRYNDLEPLAIGSTFKLYVLKTLRDLAESGEINIADSIEVRDEQKSLPSGILHMSKSGYKVTIGKAAELMISISDNTATDMLIELIGRARIEVNAPANMKPFYKTREMFVLKLGKDSSYVNDYMKMDLTNKYAVLKELETFDLTVLNPFDFVKPKYLEIEWYANTNELCRIIEQLYGDKAISINKAFAKNQGWKYAGYKGGSEPGVLNLTFLVKKDDNSPLISLSATVNNPDDNVDDMFMVVVQRILEYLYSKSD